MACSAACGAWEFAAVSRLRTGALPRSDCWRRCILERMPGCGGRGDAAGLGVVSSENELDRARAHAGAAAGGGALVRRFRVLARAGSERPNKHELFLHLCLAQGWRNRMWIVARRLLPTNPPRVEKDPHVTKADWRMRLRRMAFRAGFLARRALLH